MNSTTVPYHQAQIVRTLPAWARTLHPEHISRIVKGARKDYLDENGSPYAWYAAASAEDQAQVRQLIALRDTQYKALRTALKDFRQIGEFCKPLLEGRLAEGINVEKAQYLHQPFKVYTTQQNPPGLEFGNEPELIKRPDGPAHRRSLLEAALHNFQGPDDLGPFDALTLGQNNDAPLPDLELQAFVDLCRDLDLGRQYQEHLQSIYDGPAQATIQQLWIDASRQALNAEAEIATLKNLLSTKGRDALAQLCDSISTPRYGEHALHCWRFSLFDIPIHDVLLIGPDEPSQINPCILYIPQDSEHPVREFASLHKAGDHLRQRLLQTTFRQHLIGFADKNNQAELSRKLDDALFEARDAVRKPRKAPELRFNRTRLALPIWPVLFHNHKRRLKADARAIAVPTADADAKARKAQLQQWLDAGMNLLNIAAFFVPGLDAVMLGVFAYDLMDSVFTGFEAWEEGDTQEALQQLESLAINAVVAAGFAGGSKVLKASGFVDALESVWKDGRQRLWHPDMRGYSTSRSLPVDMQANAEGLYVIDDKSHVRLHGKLYEIVETDGEWHVRHPNDPDAYAPAVRYLGDQRWQLAHDNPLEWDDTQLLEALGQYSHGLDQSERLSAMRITDTDASTLRRHQVSGTRPPALLADTLLRLRLDNDVQSVITRVRHGLPLAAHMNFALPELVRLPGWPVRYRLKVFKGAEKWGDADYYGAEDKPGTLQIEIGREELDDGKLSQVLLAGMDEGAIQQLLPDITAERRLRALDELLADRLVARRADVFTSMLESHRPTLGVEAQTLGRQFTGLPDSALEELVTHASSRERDSMKNGRVPLRVAEEARYLQARARLDRALLGLYRPGLANTDSKRLHDALMARQPHASAVQLLNAALADRPGCAALLGQQPIKPSWRSPMRLAHGRIGYPLSGRATGQLDESAARRRLKSLYPSLGSGQISSLQAELSRTGDLGTAIRKLEIEWRDLDRDLKTWTTSAPDLMVLLERQGCAERIKDAWRRTGDSNPWTLTLAGIRLRQLPALTARLTHIRELRLPQLGLQQLDAPFLAAFPNLQVLEAPRNALANIPADVRNVLAAMPNLRKLNLNKNRLTLDESALQWLAGLPLEALALAHNQITLDEELAKHFQTMVHLKSLSLEFNALRHAPDVSFLARLESLDLRNCQLEAWPEGLTTLMSQSQYRLRYLDLSSNRIHHIPHLENLLQTPYARGIAARLPRHNWLLNYNDLEARSARRLRENRVNVHELAPEMPAWQNLWRNSASERQERVWNELFENNEHGDLHAVLERLTQSVEARRDPEGLRTRVWALLEQAHDDTALRERLDQVAQSFPPTCGDAGADAFSALEVELLARQASGQTQGTTKPLLKLYRQLYRREKVNELADRISLQRSLRKQALQDNVMDEQLPAHDVLDVPAAFPDTDLATGLVDDIEVRLALRQALAGTLDYPEPSSGMLYRQTARINQQIIDNVRDAVLDLDADTSARQQWMAEQPVWVDYIKREHASQFEALTDFWRPGLDYLLYCLDEGQEPITWLDASIVKTLEAHMPSPVLDENGGLIRVALNDAEYYKATSALNSEQQKVEAGLLLSLTRQAEVLNT